MDKKEFMDRQMLALMKALMVLTDSEPVMIGLFVATKDNLHYMSSTVIPDEKEADALEEKSVYNVLLRVVSESNKHREEIVELKLSE